MRIYHVNVSFTLYDAGAFPESSGIANQTRLAEIHGDLQTAIRRVVYDFAKRDDVAVTDPRLTLNLAFAGQPEPQS